MLGFVSAAETHEKCFISLGMSYRDRDHIAVYISTPADVRGPSVPASDSRCGLDRVLVNKTTYSIRSIRCRSVECTRMWMHHGECECEEKRNKDKTRSSEGGYEY